VLTKQVLEFAAFDDLDAVAVAGGEVAAALPTQEVVTMTPLAAFMSSITPARACTDSTSTILL
jgi:hypothetical protein